MTDVPYATGASAGSQSPSTTTGSTTQVAQEQAKGVAADAKEGAQRVGQTGAQQAREVAGEAKRQARQLLDQAREEANQQLGNQHQRAAAGLRSLGSELDGIAAGKSQEPGVAAELAGEAAQRVNALAGWLQQREPGDVLREVKDFARRKPGTFLAAAAALGLVGGRLTRGLAQDAGSTSNEQPSGRHRSTAEDVHTTVEVQGNLATTAYEPSTGITGAQVPEPSTTGLSTGESI